MTHIRNSYDKHVQVLMIKTKVKPRTLYYRTRDWKRDSVSQSEAANWYRQLVPALKPFLFW